MSEKESFGGICELCGDKVDCVTVINKIHICKKCADPIIKIETLDPRSYIEKNYDNYSGINFLLFRPTRDIIINSPLGFTKYVFYKDTLYHLKDPRNNPQPHWYQLFTGQVKKLANYRCEKCRSTLNLQVHHEVRVKVQTSRLLDLENVTLLCEKCHQQEHDEAQTWEEWDGSYDTCPLCGGKKKSSFEICYNCSGREVRY